MSLRDPLAAIVIFAFSLVAFLMAGRVGGGAELFPRGVSAIMMVCSALLFVRGLKWPSEGERMERSEAMRIGLALVLTVGYVALIVPLGFITSSLIYIPLSAYLLGLRNHALIWITTIIFLSSIYYFFERLFHTPLPPEVIIRLLSRQ